MLPYRAVLLCGSLLLACTGEAPKEGAAQQPSPPAKVEVAKVEVAKVEVEPTPTPPPVEAKVETPPAPSEVTLDSKVGVAECDDYVARYRACLEKVPEREKLSFTTALLSQLRTWVKAKDDAKLAAALVDDCTAAAAAARSTTRVLGCVWREGDSETPEVPQGGKDRPQPRGMRADLDL